MLSELEQIDQSSKLCMQFVGVEDEINNCRQIIGAPQLSRREFKKIRKFKKRSLKKALSVFICFLICSFSIIIGTSIIGNSLLTDIQYPSIPGSYSTGDYKNNIFNGELVIFIGFIPIIILAIKNIIATNNAYATASEQQRRDKENAIARLKTLQPKYEKLKKQVYDKTICIFPDDYIYGAGYINDLIRNKRADSLKEAINIYEQDMNNLKLRSELSNQLNSLGNEMRNVRDEIRDLRDETAYQGEIRRNSSRETNRILQREATKNDIRRLNNL